VTEPMTQTEDRRAKYKAVVDYEIAMTQARFQTLAIFIAAVGFVVGRGHLSRPTAALFLLITVGLWIVDLRNRDVLAKWRSVGRDLEEEMLDGDELDQTLDGWGRLFPPERLGRNKELKLGVFATKHPIKGRMAGVLVHQFGVDVIFSAVIGFAVALLCGQSGWPGALIVAGVVALFALLATWWGRRRDRSCARTPSAPAES
jgi:hypothetical protein